MPKRHLKSRHKGGAFKRSRSGHSRSRTGRVARPMKTAGVARIEYAYGRMAGEDKYLDVVSTAAPATTFATATANYYSPYNTVTNGGTTLAFTSFNNALAAQQSLIPIPQGTTKNNRIGNGVKIKRIRFRCSAWLAPYLQSNTTSGLSAGGTSGYSWMPDRLRVIVFLDRQANGAAASQNDILEWANTTSCEFFSPLRMDNMHRFKILKDKIVASNTNVQFMTDNQAGDPNVGHITAAAPVVNFKMSVRFNDLPVRFNSTTGALSELVTDNIGVLALSEVSVATKVAIFARVYYKDH